MKKVAVVILNWEGERMLKRFLGDVVANTDTSIAEVVVADNGSHDGSMAYVEANFPEVRRICLDRNYGFAEGYNRALAQVDAPYVVLLNSDVGPAAGWVGEMLGYMEAHPRCAACQPKILSVESPGSFEYAGACGGFLDRNGYPYCRGRIFSTVEADRGQYDEPMEVDWASGAALMVRRELYFKVGGLDPQFFAHMEEIDLCWRLRRSGYTVDVVPSARVYHLGGGSLPAGNPRKTYLNFRNNLLLLYKNLPEKSRRGVLIKRRLLDTLAWGMMMAKLDFKNANAILRAHFDYRKMKKLYEDDRSAAVTLPEDDCGLRSRPNIIVDYYLRGKKEWEKVRRERLRE